MYMNKKNLFPLSKKKEGTTINSKIGKHLWISKAIESKKVFKET